MPKRILITGGGGFLGTMLARRLLEHRKESGLGYEVAAIDLLPSRVEGVRHFPGSILDITDVSRAVEGSDVVVHLAALLGVANTEDKRLDCLNINIQGTVNILNACVSDKVKRVVFASSSEVYGEQRKLPIAEDNPLNPKSIYAVTKLAGEEYVRAYAGRYGMGHVIFRLFNAYGAGQVGQFVMSRFVKAALEGKPPTLYGDGTQVRAFCYGTDIVDGITRGIFSKKASGETINLGNDAEPISMKELAERVVRVSGKKNLKVITAKPGQGDRAPNRDILRRYPDISKARRLLGYEPKVSLDQGIKLLFAQERIAESWQAR